MVAYKGCQIVKLGGELNRYAIKSKIYKDAYVSFGSNSYRICKTAINLCKGNFEKLETTLNYDYSSLNGKSIKQEQLIKINGNMKYRGWEIIHFRKSFSQKKERYAILSKAYENACIPFSTLASCTDTIDTFIENHFKTDADIEDYGYGYGYLDLKGKYIPNCELITKENK